MRKNHGFTLIEVVITVALIGILMSLAIPGIMNYFSNVDMDKARSEASSVMSIAQSSQDKLSLTGNYNPTGKNEVVDVDTLKSIVKKSKGLGEIKKLVFENGKITHFEYIVSGYSVQLSAEGNLIVINGESEDNYYQ